MSNPLRTAGALAAWLPIVLAACGGGGLTVDAELFAGLDRAVVAEVLSNPVALAKIDETSDAREDSLAQGIVINFSVCRDVYRVLEEWLRTGAPPALAPLPVPLHPQDPSYKWWRRDYETLESFRVSGEPNQFRTWLTGDGSCGQWIPATPNDLSGPTIKDAIEENL